MPSIVLTKRKTPATTQPLWHPCFSPLDLFAGIFQFFWSCAFGFLAALAIFGKKLQIIPYSAMPNHTFPLQYHRFVLIKMQKHPLYTIPYLQQNSNANYYRLRCHCLHKIFCECMHFIKKEVCCSGKQLHRQK